MKLITTSWDDGYPADFRLAELLDKYKLAGTFYIPASNHEHQVMTEKELVVLSQSFEIGGHTMTHAKMNKTSDVLFSAEIKGCYVWLNNLLNEAPVSFCFPVGKYNQGAVDYVYKTGFKIIRTTELLNPWLDPHNSIIPTTIQAYPHSGFTYVKHLVKRVNLKSLLLYLKSGKHSDSLKLVEYYLNYILKNGGCLHLWGHSWEIEENNLWYMLEEIFKVISGISEIEYVENKDLLAYKSFA